LYLDLTPIDSPIYSSYEFGETSSFHLGPSFSIFLCLDDQFPTTFLSHSRTTHNLPSFRELSPHTLQVSASNPSMATHRGAGVGGSVVGGVAGGSIGSQVPLPGIFSKVLARYAPLVLSVPLHDLLENYMKHLPKFTG
jgi:hypothetical protein